MDIRVAGHQVETGESLQTHVSDRLTQLSERYLNRPMGASVTFGRGPYDDFTCDIVAPAGKGQVLKASNRASDAHVAFEGAADKIERQMKRHHDRLREHRGGPADEIMAPMANASYRLMPETREDEPPKKEMPAIVAETKVDIPEADVAEAVWMLDLRNTNALMFMNRKSGVHNMVYRRGDGTIGWVEPDAS